jgi:hypothetical protein
MYLPYTGTYVMKNYIIGVLTLIMLKNLSGRSLVAYLNFEHCKHFSPSTKTIGVSQTSTIQRLLGKITSC